MKGIRERVDVVEVVFVVTAALFHVGQHFINSFFLLLVLRLYIYLLGFTFFAVLNIHTDVCYSSPDRDIARVEVDEGLQLVIQSINPYASAVDYQVLRLAFLSRRKTTLAKHETKPIGLLSVYTENL